MEFQYYLPVHLIFGINTAEKLGEYTAKFGKKALLVTGKNSTKKSGILDKAIQWLKDSNVDCEIFDEVEQNPLITTVYKGAEAAADAGCDVIVGIGGGSVMDAAKGIAFYAKNGGDLSDYIFGLKSSDDALPVVLVSTTCGTGSEVNGFAVLSNPETKDKKALKSIGIIPKAAIADPALMVTMPKSILASVGFDTLCHNIEAYLSKRSNPLSTVLSLEGIRLAAESLPKVYSDPSDMKSWEDLTFSNVLGGMVIYFAGTAAPHGLEHPASGLKDIVHGRGLAALMPAVMEETIKYAPEKCAVISCLMGGKNEMDLVERINLFLENINLKTSLSKEGITENDIIWMTENCQKIASVNLENHPVFFDAESLRRIYTKAL